MDTAGKQKHHVNAEALQEAERPTKFHTVKRANSCASVVSLPNSPRKGRRNGMRFFTQITRIVSQCAAAAVLSTLIGALSAPAQAQITYLPSFNVQNYTVTNGFTNPPSITPFVREFRRFGCAGAEYGGGSRYHHARLLLLLAQEAQIVSGGASNTVTPSRFSMPTEYRVPPDKIRLETTTTPLHSSTVQGRSL